MNQRQALFCQLVISNAIKFNGGGNGAQKKQRKSRNGAGAGKTTEAAGRWALPLLHSAPGNSLSEHVFYKYPVPSRRIIHQHMGHGSYDFPIL